MKTAQVSKIAIAFGILLAITLSGCSLLNAGKPVAVIASPPSGTQVDVNTEVQVQVNATDEQGIVRIDLLANGTVVGTEISPQATGQPTFSAILRYTPKSPGAQVVEVRAYNRKGDASAPVSINIQVRDAQALATGTPDIFPTLTPLPNATATLAPTSAPPAITIVVQQPPPQPPPPTACPGPPVIASFAASPSPITTGNSTTLSWGAITNATSAIIDHEIGNIPRPGGIKSVNPTTTTIYTLTAAGCGGITTKQVTVTVKPGAAQFSGDWRNDSPNPSSYPNITRLNITNLGQTLDVHGYLKTTTTDFDLGTESGTFNGEPFVIKFGTAFRLTMTLNDAAWTQLKVVADCPAPGTPCATGTHFFHRFSLPIFPVTTFSLKP